MNRRDFLSFLGFGAGALILLPELPAAPALDICTDYPVPYFTGFRYAIAEPRMLGQFLWNVLYEDETGKTRLVHWFQNVSLHTDMLERVSTGKLLWMQGHGHSAKRIEEPSAAQKQSAVTANLAFEQWKPDDIWPIHQSQLTEKSVNYVRLNVSMGFTHYVHLVDSIIEKAHRGLVEDPEFKIVSDNPDYDPTHLATHDSAEFLDEDGDPVPNYCHQCAKTTSRHADVPIRRFRLVDSRQMWKKAAATARPVTNLADWTAAGKADPYAYMWDIEQPKLEPFRLDSLIDEIAQRFAEKEVLV